MEIFDENFLNGLSDDPKIAFFEICTRYLRLSNTDIKYQHHLEAYVLAEAFIKANDLDIEIPPLPNEGRKKRQQTILYFLANQRDKLNEYVQLDEEEQILQRLRGEFSVHIGKTFVYEFSDGDLQRVQVLINELRELVATSGYFDSKHQRRLLNRIERLQQELHKRQSDLDHFWGLVGDAGIVLGKFGENAKPLVDRIREITNIVWRTQSRAEELPSDSRPALLSSE